MSRKSEMGRHKNNADGTQDIFSTERVHVYSTSPSSFQKIFKLQILKFVTEHTGMSILQNIPSRSSVKSQIEFPPTFQLLKLDPTESTFFLLHGTNQLKAPYMMEFFYKFQTSETSYSKY